MVTCELAARGVRIKEGTLEYALARMSLERERQIQFATTLCLVNAIMDVGNRIVAAVSQSPSNQLNGDVVKKSVEALQKLLLPEEAERTAKKAEKAKDILAREMAGGPIRFRPQNQSGKRGRKRR